MPSSVSAPPDVSPADPAQRAFLTILPVLRGIAGAYFRDVRCPARRDDLVAEAVALAFTWCRRLVARPRVERAPRGCRAGGAYLQVRTRRPLSVVIGRQNDRVPDR